MSAEGSTDQIMKGAEKRSLRALEKDRRAHHKARPSQLVEQALLQGVPSPEGDGMKLDPVISGGVYLGNDTSHESFADNFSGSP